MDFDEFTRGEDSTNIMDVDIGGFYTCDVNYKDKFLRGESYEIIDKIDGYVYLRYYKGTKRVKYKMTNKTFIQYFNTDDKKIVNFSPIFNEILNKALLKNNSKNDTRFLMHMINDEFIKAGILYVSITDDPTNNVSYLSKRNLRRVKDGRVWDNNYRQETRIGRLLARIKFNDGSNNNVDTIENFVSEFKKKLRLFYFELVEGEDIRKWYYEGNYEKGGGSLNKSCMRQKDDQHRFDIYVDNPQVCKMLIMKYDENSDKILGRALVWNLNIYGNSVIYMDRIYTSNDFDKSLFVDYAIKNDWMIYPQWYETLKVQVKKENGIKKYFSFLSKVPSNEEFPFADTFRYYYYRDGILSNCNTLSKHYIHLNNHAIEESYNLKYLKLFEGYSSNKNPAIWKGKKFWIGAVSLLDGQIEEVHTYEEAEINDFHHSFYFSMSVIERIKDDESSIFWVDDGEILGEWRHDIGVRIKYKILNQIQIS